MSDEKKSVKWKVHILHALDTNKRTDMSSTGGGNKTEQPVVQAYTVEETTKPSTTAVEVSPLTGNSKISR